MIYVSFFFDHLLCSYTFQGFSLRIRIQALVRELLEDQVDVSQFRDLATGRTESTSRAGLGRLYDLYT